MQVKVNDQVLFELTDIQKKVIQNDIDKDIFEEVMKRRLFWVINHKYEQCIKMMKAQWEPKLAAKGVASIPVDKDAFAELVFAQEDYKDRNKRDKEVKLK